VDKVQELFAAVEAKELTVDGIRAMQVASLRYFDPAGSFASAVQNVIGRLLPQALRADSATSGDDAQSILAWRSPTETLLLSTDQEAFTDLKERLAGATDGCMVDQTGGWCAVRVRGGRAGDLLLRLGASASIPGVGEARSSRLADLPVLALCVQPGTLILLVERVYLKHFLGWIATTVADL
jgi:heterotetrameric sarcosine oxidase gamma subunit